MDRQKDKWDVIPMCRPAYAGDTKIYRVVLIKKPPLLTGFILSPHWIAPFNHSLNIFFWNAYAYLRNIHCNHMETKVCTKTKTLSIHFPFLNSFCEKQVHQHLTFLTTFFIYVQHLICANLYTYRAKVCVYYSVLSFLTSEQPKPPPFVFDFALIQELHTANFTF